MPVDDAGVPVFYSIPSISQKIDPAPASQGLCESAQETCHLCSDPVWGVLHTDHEPSKLRHVQKNAREIDK
jgi:hypothetical protein